MSSAGRPFDELLDRALDLDPAAREEWLVEIGREHPQTAERIRAAITARNSPNFQAFLEGPPLLARAQELAGSLIGRAVGSYVIDAELGRGGMGSVWRARRADGRYSGFVAVKFLHAAWLNTAGTQRFQVECNALARLNHPNIARLLDAGVLDGTQPYLLLEYVEGERIDAYCERMALGLHERIRLMIEVLEAVAHAHANLVVHRDLKPDNILVMPSGTVKLLDFGIARLLDQDLGGSEATRAAGAMLTPLFAAPEQLENAPITTATDVYAIGIILYELLAGVRAFQPSSSSKIELMRAVLEGRVRPPSVAASAQGRPPGALKGDLDNVILKAIRRDPGERYSSAAAFADDLKRYLAHEPVSAAKASVVYRFGKFVRRNRAAVAGASLALLAVTIGAVTALVQAHHAEANAREALAARARALDQLSYSEATTGFLGFLLQENPARAFRASELLARGERAVERQFADDARLRARLLRTIGSSYGDLSDAESATRVLKAARASAVRAGDPILATSIDCDIASASGQSGNLQDAKALVDRAILRLRSAPVADVRDELAGCLYSRSDILHDLGDMSGSLANGQESLALLDPPRAGQRVLAAQVSAGLAAVHVADSRFDLAIPMYERAVQQFVLAGRGDSTALSAILNEFAIALAKAGQWQKAADQYRRAISITDDVPGRALPAAYESNYGKLLIDLGAPDEARDHIERSLRIAVELKERRGIGYGHIYLGQVDCALGRLPECATELGEGREILQSIYPPGHEIFGTLDVLDAQLLIARGELRRAEVRLDDALALFARHKNHSSYENVALDLVATVAAELGNSDATQRAELAVQRARKEMRGLPHSAWLGQALVSQALVDLRMGRAAAMRDHAAVALAELEPTAGASAAPTQRARALLQARASP